MKNAKITIEESDLERKSAYGKILSSKNEIVVFNGTFS